MTRCSPIPHLATIGAATVLALFSLGDGSAESPEVMAAAALDRQVAYVGQQVTYLLTFDRRVPLAKPPAFKDPSWAGFRVYELPPPRHELNRDVDGIAYRSQTVGTALFPTTPGIVEIGPTTVTVSPGATTPDRAANAVRLATAAVHLRVLALPERDRPPGFQGLVGDFSMRMSVQPRAVAAGEPIAVTVTIEGTGNIAALPEPKLGALDAAQVVLIENKRTVQVVGTSVGGSLTASFSVVPERAGTLFIEPAPVVCFNPVRERYQRLSVSREEVAVRATAAAAPNGGQPPSVEAGSGSATPERPRPDVGPAELAGSGAAGPAPASARLERQGRRLHRTGEALITDVRYWLLHLIPWLILGARIAWRRLLPEPHRQAQRRTQRTAHKLLLRAKAATARDDLDKTYEALGAALAALSATGSLAEGAGVSRADLDGLAPLARRCELARFGGMLPARPTVVDDLELVEALLARLPAAASARWQGAHNRGPGPLASTLILLAGLASVHCGADRPGPAEIAFDQAVSAIDADDCDLALGYLSTVIAAGVNDAAAEFNTGLCLEARGLRSSALLSYRRVLRLNPADRAALARAHRLAAELGVLPHHAVLAAPTPGLLRAGRDAAAALVLTNGPACAGSLCYATAMLLLLLGSPRDPRRGRASAAFLLAVAAGAWSAGALALAASRRPEVIVTSGAASARSGPGFSFGVVTTLPEGAAAKVRAIQGPWLLVDLPDDGGLGWLSDDDAAMIHRSGGSPSSAAPGQ
ncbi:MAG: BatD family protein [Candidatus Schekmanbacteria bacterium]|nr:BatD family protein [Candidatus Schekmanbacteria bacterium]